ncbi:FAD-dependent monooxygenase, partial [Bradyrhizobium sp.]|uniref:FAD-dependent monooxygenase n=1 Tax=Bradyrhizobium sp. TaxID=376 RepID=UPI003C368EA5
MNMNQTVMIVGAGPVGLTLAIELARYGVPLRIFEKAARRTDKSKALVIWSRTLELLDRQPGGSLPFVAAGFKVDAVRILAGDKEIGRVGIAAVDSPYPYALMLPQSETERLLEERLNALGVQVEREAEVETIDLRADGVDAVVRRADGAEVKASADWLAGCDGAHSLVRHTIGAAFAGETMTSDWMLADVHMQGYPVPDTEVSVYWHQDGAFIIFPISPGRYRLIADQPQSGAEHPPTPSLAQVQAMINRRGTPGMIARDPIWLAGFRINGRKVADYRHGRAFLCGDAAHVHSPAGGQGMNTGMQDAVNLAWKLALVAKGVGRETLLDSYSAERSAVGKQVLRAAQNLTVIGTMKNPVAQTIRNAVGHLVLGLAPVQHAMSDTMTEMSVGYPGSPLNGKALGGGPKPGARIAPIAGQTPIGSG